MVTELTIFATPKRFEGRFERIQRNAVWSWRSLGDDVEVILVGDDDGTADLCASWGLRHLPEVARSPRGVPLLDDLWRRGQEAASAPRCLFANADIVFTDDLLPALRAVDAQLTGPYLMVGQRWDVDLDEALEHGRDPHWTDTVRRRATSEGTLNSPLWIDWFAFPTGQYDDLIGCVIGRPGYDHWLVWHTLSRGIPVIDATDAVIAVHQHHDYSHGGGHQDVWSGADAQINKALIGGRAHMRTIANATLRLGEDRRLDVADGPKYRLGRWQARLGPVLEASAGLRHRIGLDAEAVQRLAPRRRLQRVS